MPPPTQSASLRHPKYSLHRASGQAVVRLTDVHTAAHEYVYLGTHGSKTSRERYDQVIAEWLARGRRVKAPPGEERGPALISQILLMFLRHAKSYYRRPDGSPTQEAGAFTTAVRHLRSLYGHTPAADFGPLKLKAVRARMIEDGWHRGSINKQIARIRHVFKWAVAEELVPSSVLEGLRALLPLKAGRTQARESKPIKPVPIAHVEAILPHVSAQIAAMIRLQLLTGMRSSEVLSMRESELQTTGKLWCYVPGHHKTAHHGHAREIYLGPQAQGILRPLLKFQGKAPLFATGPLFSAAASEQERRQAMHGRRKTPLNAGNRPGSNRKRKPKFRPSDFWTVTSYRRAIARACLWAFPPPAQLERKKIPGGPKRVRWETDREWQARLGPAGWAELKQWRKDHHWHPHQLRHTAATELRKRFGIEAASVALGHRNLRVTEIYAEKNIDAAKRIAAEVG